MGRDNLSGGKFRLFYHSKKIVQASGAITKMKMSYAGFPAEQATYPALGYQLQKFFIGWLREAMVRQNFSRSNDFINQDEIRPDTPRYGRSWQVIGPGINPGAQAFYFESSGLGREEDRCLVMLSVPRQPMTVVTPAKRNLQP